MLGGSGTGSFVARHVDVTLLGLTSGEEDAWSHVGARDYESKVAISMFSMSSGQHSLFHYSRDVRPRSALCQTGTCWGIACLMYARASIWSTY